MKVIFKSKVVFILTHAILKCNENITYLFDIPYEINLIQHCLTKNLGFDYLKFSNIIKHTEMVTSFAQTNSSRIIVCKKKNIFNKCIDFDLTV